MSTSWWFAPGSKGGRDIIDNLHVYSYVIYNTLLPCVYTVALKYVTVHEQIRHNAQKHKNSLFSQHHNSGTTCTIGIESILGIGVVG